MPKVIVSPLAQADIDEIWDHIARDPALLGAAIIGIAVGTGAVLGFLMPGGEPPRNRE
jgi:plasmid stabilization system protein ParE